jgi:hypothetical protein
MERPIWLSERLRISVKAWAVMSTLLLNAQLHRGDKQGGALDQRADLREVIFYR